MFSFVLLMIAFIVVGWLWIWREQRIAAAAGMSPHAPVCARCFYQLGGWPSPICPECGTDVRVAGVRTGPRQNAVVFAILLAISITLLQRPALIAAQWLFAVQHTNISAMYESRMVPHFYVGVETRGSWHRFLPLDHHETVLHLSRLDLQQGNVVGRGARFEGSGVAAHHELRYSERTAPATESQVADALRSVLEAGETDDVLRAHRESVQSLIERIETTRQTGQLDLKVLGNWLDPVLGSKGSFSGSSMRTISRPGFVILALLVIVVVVLCAMYVRIRYGTAPSWRSPGEGEWALIQPASVAAGRADV